MKHQIVYRAPRRMSEAQRDALIEAWVSLAVDAVSEARGGQSFTARSNAKRARKLIAAFGVRVDGRRTSPLNCRSAAVRP